MSDSVPSSASSADRADAGPSADAGAAPAGDDPLSPPSPAETEAEPEPEPGRAPEVRLLMEAPEFDLPLGGWLEPMLRQLATLAGVTAGELTVLAVDDAAMGELHQQYSGVAGTTDVLTFDLADAPERGRVEGDIVVCLDEAKRQAAARGHAPRLEALLYALHGLLHLLGEDDHDEAGYQRMHAREDELLRAAGLGAVFASGAADRSGPDADP